MTTKEERKIKMSSIITSTVAIIITLCYAPLLVSAGGVSIERFSTTANCTGPSTTELYKVGSCLHQRSVSNPNFFDFLKFVTCNNTDFVQNKYEHTNTKCEDMTNGTENPVEKIYQRTNDCLVQSDSSSILIKCTSASAKVTMYGIAAFVVIIFLYFVVETLESMFYIVCALGAVYFYLKFKFFGGSSSSDEQNTQKKSE